MKDFYNKYIKLTDINTNYLSEIAFVNIKVPVIHRKIFYIKFSEKLGNKKCYYLDNNDYLMKILKSVKIDIGSEDDKSKFLDRSNGYIEYISAPMSKFYSYIKVINDYNHPELNDEIMLFQYGSIISNKLTEFIQSNNTQIFNKSFRIKVANKNGFPDYSPCEFTNNDIIITDNNLDLNSEIYIKQINMTTIERREKLKKINELNEN